KFQEDVYASSLDQPAEPFGDSAERNDVVALVLKWWRGDRKTEGRVLRKKQCGGIGDRRIERRGFLEIGNELGERFGVHDRPGKLVCAESAAFSKNIDIFSGKLRLRSGSVVFFYEIGEMQCAEKPRGPRPDNQNLRFELFALNRHAVILS